MILDKSIDFSSTYHIGQSIIIDNREWIVAENKNGNVRLQRDGIDGSSNTMTLAIEELTKLIEQSKHQFEN